MGVVCYCLVRFFGLGFVFFICGFVLILYVYGGWCMLEDVEFFNDFGYFRDVLNGCGVGFDDVYGFVF